MYSYVIEFNLHRRGEEAEEYLADAARVWPGLWGSVPGVTGTLLLSSAFALGGDFEYQLRVDIEALSTLAAVEEAMTTESRWRSTRAEWFRNRVSARASVSAHLGGNPRYCNDGGDGAIHYVYRSAAGSSADHLEKVGSLAGVQSAQTVRPLVGGSAAEQLWLRLEKLSALDAVAQVDLGSGTGTLFGELREVDGALFAGA
jgi:hypothetical protein